MQHAHLLGERAYRICGPRGEAKSSRCAGSPAHHASRQKSHAGRQQPFRQQETDGGRAQDRPHLLRIIGSENPIWQLRERRKIWLSEVLPQKVCIVDTSDFVSRQRPIVECYFIYPSIEQLVTLVTSKVRADGHGHRHRLID